MKLLFTIVLAILLACFTAVGSSYALTFFADAGLGNFSAELLYTPDTTTATLNLWLTNTSPLANGGFLTAFAFNNPSGLITGIPSGTFTDTDFSLLGGPTFSNGINAMPFGHFDIGAGTGGDFQGGGNPSLGIGVGTQEHFTFSLTGTNLNTLTAQSFVNELSSGASPDKGNQFFVARFRGFEDGGSNKVPGVIPEPASLFLLGFGLLGARLFKRKIQS